MQIERKSDLFALFFVLGAWTLTYLAISLCAFVFFRGIYGEVKENSEKQRRLADFDMIKSVLVIIVVLL